MKARGATLVQGVFDWFKQIKFPGFYLRKCIKLDIKATISLSTRLASACKSICLDTYLKILLVDFSRQPSL